MASIGNVNIQNSLILAPMAGVTDAGFRKIARLSGAGLTVTEMISTKGLEYDSIKTAELLSTEDVECPKAVQLFGVDEKSFAIAVRNPLIAKFDIIDINMGCPVHKVNKSGAGVSLMKSIDLAQKIVRACVENTQKPITVKFRLGHNSNKNFIEFGKAMAEAGASAIALHARTKEQLYSGEADWTAIRELREAVVDIPVVANGDVVDLDSLKKCREVTGCDLVMIGRGAMGRPWIFGELTGCSNSVDKKRAIFDHINVLLKSNDERSVVLYMRHHLNYYAKGLPDSRSFKNKVVAIDDLKELTHYINQIF